MGWGGGGGTGCLQQGGPALGLAAGQEDVPGLPHGERECRGQAPGSRAAGGEAVGPEHRHRRCRRRCRHCCLCGHQPRGRAPPQELRQEGRAASGEGGPGGHPSVAQGSGALSLSFVKSPQPSGGGQQAGLALEGSRSAGGRQRGRRPATRPEWSDGRGAASGGERAGVGAWGWGLHGRRSGGSRLRGDPGACVALGSVTPSSWSTNSSAQRLATSTCSPWPVSTLPSATTTCGMSWISWT